MRGSARGRTSARKRALPLLAVLVLLSILAAACSSSSSSGGSSSGSSSGALKKGLKVFIIPKNLGNNYFTTADSAKTGGAISALTALGESGTETSGTAATPASQIPAIQAAIAKGANVLIVSATDPSALCPTLNEAMKKGITVVTYDSDAPSCRDLFVNQASTAEIGTSEVDLLAKELHDTGEIGIVSAAARMPTVVGEMMPLRFGYFSSRPSVTWVAVGGSSLPYTVDTSFIFGYFFSSCFM